jgi:hypothetical protein
MYKLGSVFLACLVLLSGVTSAQDSSELQCGDTDISTAIDSALAQLQEAKSQDASAALTSIVEVREVLAELDARCRGLTFSGTAGTVHGPLTVPEGIYRISVTTQRSFIMSSTVLQGECRHGLSDEVAIFNELDRSGKEFTAEKVFNSAGCSVLFETSNINGPYTVIFEKLK